MPHASTWSSVSSFSHVSCLTKRKTQRLTQLLWPVGKEPGVFDIVIINDDLERAYDELKAILNEVSR